MATSYNIKVEQRGAYALDKRILQDIYEAAQGFLGVEIGTDIECSKGTYKIKAEQLLEALDDPLLRAHPITKIGLSGDNYKADPRRQFSFIARDDIFLPTIEIELRGSHKDCTALASHLEKLVSAKRQSYSPIVLNGDFVSGFTTIAAVTAIAAVPIAAAYLFWGSERAVFVGVIELALFTPILALLQRFRKFVFPQLIVDVGRSADIAARAKSARTTLFVGIFLALVVGVASSLIANKIPQ